MSLEKEFAPYPEAFELKELGFDEPTLYHWHSSCKTHPFTNEICNPNCRPKTNSGIKSIGEENHVWSAPTFSQAFRWFREYQNWPIESWIQPYLSDEPRRHEAFYWRRGSSDVVS